MPTDTPIPSNTPMPYDIPISNSTCEKSEDRSITSTASPGANKSHCAEISANIDAANVKMKELETAQKGIDAAKNVALTAINPIAGVAGIIGDACKSTNSADTRTINIINQVMNIKNVSKVVNDCKNISSNYQSNTIEISPECLTATLSICSYLKDDDKKLECIKDARKNLTIDNVKQSNTSEMNNKCIINNLIKQLTAQSDSTAIQAMVQLLQTASGPATSNKSDSLNCSEVNKTLNSEQYSSNISCCLNKMANTQLNTLKSCGTVINTTQTNVNKQYNECVLGTSIDQSTTQDSNTSIESIIKIEQTAAMANSASMASIIACIAIGAALLLIPLALGFIQSQQNNSETDMGTDTETNIN